MHRPPNLEERAQDAIGRSLLRMPRAAIERLIGGSPRVVDGVALDLQVQWALEVRERARLPLFEQLSPSEARRLMDLQQPGIDAPAPPMDRVRQTTLPGPAGPIPARVYTPLALAAPAPGLVYFHGGGYVVGSLDSHDVPCRMLAARGRCVVVSVDYRLAPEAPFPAAVEDAVAAFAHVAANGEELGIDARRLAIGGDSAGGCLATVVSRLQRDAAGPLPRFQLLIYPATDPEARTPSKERLGEGFLLTRSMMDWFMDHYLGDHPRSDPRVAPLLASDLTGLPPACIAVAGFDPLRDEELAYAARLSEAAVPVEVRTYDRLVHGFVQLTGIVDSARDAVDDLGHVLYAALR